MYKTRERVKVNFDGLGTNKGYTGVTRPVQKIMINKFSLSKTLLQNELGTISM